MGVVCSDVIVLLLHGCVLIVDDFFCFAMGLWGCIFSFGDSFWEDYIFGLLFDFMLYFDTNHHHYPTTTTTTRCNNVLYVRKDEESETGEMED